MTYRTLTPAEFDRLKGVADGYCPDPANSVALIAEDEGGEIIGRMLLLQPVHIEGTWVREDKRNGMVGVRLMKKMEQVGKDLGLGCLHAYVLAEHEDYMKRLGFVKENFTVWKREL